MTHKQISFDSYSDNAISYEYYQSQKSMRGSENKRKAMVSLVGHVMQYELNDNQRECVYFVKIKGLTIKEVAKMRGVNSSTVCRHLQSAQKILNKAFEHFCCIEKFVDWSVME